MSINTFRHVELPEIETAPSEEYLLNAARMEAVIAAQPDCVKVVSPDYRLIHMNFAGLDMIGADCLDQVHGANILDLVDPEYHEVFKGSVDQAYRGIATEAEFAITSLDGTRRYMAQKAAPIFSSKEPDKVVEMVAVTRDITKSNKDMIALEEAKVIAEEANKVKSNFLATMSHEFRTPLNAILGFSEIIKEEALGAIGNQKYVEYINDIYHSGKHLLDLINDVLDISEIEANKRMLLKEQVDLEAIALHSLNTVNILAEKKQIMISVNIAANLPTIFADRRSIKQILINLLSNAVKFSHQGSVVMLNIHEDRDAVRITIQDEGIGIIEDNLKNITQPFFRGQFEAEIAASGTGLGLSIVKSLLEAHDGSLSIESTEHVGTTVTIKLPVKKNG